MKPLVWLSNSIMALAALTAQADGFVSNEVGANLAPPDYVSPAQYSAPPSYHGEGLQQQLTKIQQQGSDYGVDGNMPMYPSELAPGAGRELVKSYCAICHNTTYITMQPPLSAKHWQATVDKMRFKFGAKQFITDAQAKIIVKYLQAHYTPKALLKTASSNNESQFASSTKTVSRTFDLSLGKQTFEQNCAACHQANGQGIASAFPPLKGHAVELYKAKDGRHYLPRLVLNGLSGKIRVNKANYNGNMPAWGATLDDKHIAAVLNYILISWGNEQALQTDFEPYQASDIEALRTPSVTPAKMYQERATLELEGQ